ncbi:Hypothetical predicted protein, partial [Olea europaea subsp. europaea]
MSTECTKSKRKGPRANRPRGNNCRPSTVILDRLKAQGSRMMIAQRIRYAITSPSWKMNEE